MKRKPWMVGGIAAMMLLSACNPSTEPANGGEDGSDAPQEVSTDISEAGDVTLTVWDQEVRGGQNEQMEQLNAAFMEEYPNVTIERNSQSFEDLQTTLRLAISGDDAPDVVEANNSRGMMGQFVSSGQIICLDDYAEAYGWTDRYSEDVLNYSRYSEDATEFGQGCVYGLPQVGESVGIYYSKSKLEELGLEYPENWDDFASQLAEIKDQGETPLVLGNVEKWPAFHVFGVIQSAHVDAGEIRTLGFGNPGGSWDTDENVAAAGQLQEWVDAGYFNDDANGADYDQVWQDFAGGEGVYLIAGSWLAPDLLEAMGDDVVFALPPTDGMTSTGGTGLPFAITSASENPDVAAAYIDFITSDDAMQILADTGNVPVNNTSDYSEAAEGVVADTMNAFDQLTNEGHVVPYLDYATTTFDQVGGDALQNLIAGNLNPQEFVTTLDEAYQEATNE